MTNRTVKILGWASGLELGPAEITAVLDGETVFSGSVDLVDMTKENQWCEHAPTLFTFKIPLEFSGTKHMVITVNKAKVRFGQIVANYSTIKMGNIIYSTGLDEYADVAKMDTDGVTDPRGNEVTIDGKKQVADRTLGKGAWQWQVAAGSTFEHDLTISVLGCPDD